MSFPAYDQLAADIELGHMTWRVYMHLQRNVLNHVTPVEVKSWLLCDTLHLRPASIVLALNWLSDRGYIVEHERGARGVRRFTLAWSVTPKGTTPEPQRKAS